MAIPNTSKSTEAAPITSVYVAGEWEEQEESLLIEPGELEKSSTSSKQTKTKESSSSAAAKKLPEEVSLAELMQIISETLGTFSDIQANLARATEGFSEKQGKALIEAAKKTLTDVTKAMEAREKASKRAGIFQKITMAFTIAVTTAMIFASGGTLASTLIPTAMMILTTAKTEDGKGAFNFAVDAIVDLLPKGEYNKELIASLIVTTAAMAIGAGSARLLTPASTLATTIEVSSQVALDSGLPQALAEATGKEWVMWLTMSLLTVTMMGSGLKSAHQNYEAAQAAGQRTAAGQLAKILSDFTGSSAAEMEVAVREMARAIQLNSQVFGGGFQIATGAAMKQAADASYLANTKSALLTKQHALLSQSNTNSAELQERMVQVISDVYEMMTSITKHSGKDLEALSRQTV